MNSTQIINSFTEAKDHKSPENPAEHAKAIIAEFNKFYASSIINLIEDFLKGPGTRSAQEFHKIEIRLYFRLHNANDADKAQIKQWYEGNELRFKASEKYTVYDYFLLGSFHLSGVAIGTRNQEEAVKFFKKAGDYSLAQWRLGALYANDTGIDQHNEEAEKLFKLVMNGGCAMAWSGMGALLTRSKNYSAAMTHFTQAQELGDLSAFGSLGGLYYGGFVTKNEAYALELFEQAAKQGSISALYSLGHYHDSLKKDFKTAELYLVPAAERGNVSAMCLLEEELAKQKDADSQAKSRVWLKKAAEFNSIFAIVALGRFLREEGDYKGAEELFLQAVQPSKRFLEDDLTSIAFAHFNLAVFYWLGFNKAGVKNIGLAAFYFRQLMEHVSSQDKNNEHYITKLKEFFTKESTQHPAICYHIALGLKDSPWSKEKEAAQKSLTELIQNPPPGVDINALYQQGNDTPLRLKPFVDEETVMRILFIADILSRLEPFNRGIGNIVLEYEGPISAFALEVVKNEVPAKAMVEKIKESFLVSASIFGMTVVPSRKEAIKQAERKEISYATALERAL